MHSRRSHGLTFRQDFLYSTRGTRLGKLSLRDASFEIWMH
jgi:hypothetical protein